MAEQFGSTPGRVVPAGAKVSPGGEQGPPGPPGPVGEVTTSEGIWNYHKTDTDTDTAPVSGRFKTDSGNYRDATQIAIHAVTIQGIDRTNTLRTLLVGDIIQCQDTANGAAWCRYTLLAPPVDHGSWFQLDVALEADGGVASGDNQEIAFTFTAGGAGGVSDGFVRYDAAQTLTEAQQTQARVNIYAAPFDAFAYNGMQINGAMEVSQENGNLPVTINGNAAKYIVDGWQVAKTGTSVISAYQLLGNTDLMYPAGLQLQTTTAQPTIGTDYVRFLTVLEGWRVARAAWGTPFALPITIGFWMRASLVGNYRACAYNFDGSAVTPWATFNIPEVATWKWTTITLPEQTTGTWQAGSLAGVNIAIEVASNAVPNTAGVIGQYAAITGVVVLPGIQAPTAAQSPLIMRPADQELAACKRYWNRTYVHNRFWPSGGSLSHDVLGVFNFPFRAVPTLTVVAGSRLNVSAINVDTATVEGTFRHSISNSIAGDSYCISDVVTGDARL